MELNGGTWVTPNIQLVRRLDEGAMGSVWVADHMTLGTEVAVKFVTTRLSDQAVVLKRLEAEAKNAARIKSPHVVRTFDFGALEDGTPYIVMELLEGENLHQRIDTGQPLTPREVAVVVMHTARCLHGAHQLGIVHRDIKPENLFLLDNDDDELFVKVLDFGIAKGFGKSMTQPGLLIGTIPYMSRDRLVDRDRLDHRADLWSLAVVAYEALTAKLPFDGDSHDEICAAIWRGDFTPPSQLDSRLNEQVDAWFKHALHKERTERPASAKQLAASFVRAISTLDGAFDSGEHDDWRISQLDLTPYVPSTPLPPASDPPRSSPISSLRPISYPESDPAPASQPTPGPSPLPVWRPESAAADTKRPTLEGIPTPLPPRPVTTWRSWVIAGAVAASAVGVVLTLRQSAPMLPALHGPASALAEAAARAAVAAAEAGRAEAERAARDEAERERAAREQAEREHASDDKPSATGGPLRFQSKPATAEKSDSEPALEKDLGF